MNATGLGPDAATPAMNSLMSDREEALLARFAAKVADVDDPVRAGRALGLGPMRSHAVMLALRRAMGDQAR